MKCFSLAILVLFFSFAVQADPSVNTIPNQAADNSQNDRQVYLPSGQGTIPVQITDDGEVDQRTGTAKHAANTVDKAINKVEHGAEKEKSTESIKEKWGVDNFRVRLTSAGYMLDVRYRVYDKTKAKPLFSRKLRPYAIEEASNVKYGVPASPKVGFLRQAPSHIKENKEYFLMIANPGKRLKPGDKLTLVIGDFRIEHLTIE